MKTIPEDARDFSEKQQLFVTPDVELAGTEEKPTVSVTVSSEVLDRHRQVVLLEAYDLENFMKNPVFLQNHGIDNQDIIGKWTSMKPDKTTRTLRGVGEYFLDSPGGPWAYQLVKKGIAAFSVGFNVRPGGVLWGRKLREDEDLPKRIKDMEPDVVFTDVELLEVSQVTIPANPEAVLRTNNAEVLQCLELANEKNIYGRKVPGELITDKQKSSIAGPLAFLRSEVKRHEKKDPVVSKELKQKINSLVSEAEKQRMNKAAQYADKLFGKSGESHKTSDKSDTI